MACSTTKLSGLADTGASVMREQVVRRGTGDPHRNDGAGHQVLALDDDAPVHLVRRAGRARRPLSASRGTVDHHEEPLADRALEPGARAALLPCQEQGATL